MSPLRGSTKMKRSPLASTSQLTEGATEVMKRSMLRCTTSGRIDLGDRFKEISTLTGRQRRWFGRFAKLGYIAAAAAMVEQLETLFLRPS